MNHPESSSSQIHHLDTSALVKLVLYPDVKEPGSDSLNSFKRTRTGFYTLDLVVGETLNVLKLKAFSRKPERRILSSKGYQICVDRLLEFVRPKHSVKVTNAAIADRSFCGNAAILVRTYEIDFVDACVVLMARDHKPFHSKQNLLITADESMKKASEAVSLPLFQVRH